MFCPSCGATNSIDQRFCRSCGLNLEHAAQSLRDQFPMSGPSDLARREARLEKFGQVAFGGFLVVVVSAVVGLVYAILARFVFSGDNPAVGILLTAFIIFAMLSLAYVIFREDLKEKRMKIAREEEPPGGAPPVVTGRLIEEREFEPVPTVTEDTTDLLPSQKRK